MTQTKAVLTLVLMLVTYYSYVGYMTFKNTEIIMNQAEEIRRKHVRR